MDEIIAIRRQRYEASRKPALDLIREEKIQAWGKKYSHYFESNLYKKSANIINRFLINKFRWDIPLMNSNSIPGIYRFRVVLTTYHRYEYSEEPDNLLYDEDINVNRIIYKSIMDELTPARYIGDYLFDIRDLYLKRNEPIYLDEEDEEPFFLQPEEHIRLEKQYKKINTIIFQQQLEYDRSLVNDFKKGMNEPCPLSM